MYFLLSFLVRYSPETQARRAGQAFDATQQRLDSTLESSFSSRDTDILVHHPEAHMCIS
jgi:hypothetical protein